ncbi:MAG: 1-(5-phosphoribosyl)-5-[(5-phosphoribosylamino)methylideneamino] imidazole-4-carboxamide isomerase [Chloroflexota bacterium]
MATARVTFEILPAIDLRAGRVVRLRQGEFDRETAYDARPEGVADSFAAAGAAWLHLVDLDGARTGIPTQISEIAGIVAAVGERASVEVAGGLRDERAVDEALAAGAARAVIGTQALRDPAFAGRLVGVHGAHRIAVAIDVRNGRAVGHGWTTNDPGIDAAEAIRRIADAGVETFEVTAIERDGLLEGPDLTLYDRLVRLDRGSIIASGGIATLDDLRAVRGAGCSAAIVGRALYEGQLDLAEMMALAREPD